MNEIIREYDNILIGNKTDYSSYLFKKGAAKAEETALSIIRYALSYYLSSNTDYLSEVVNNDLMKEMKLYPLIRSIKTLPLEYKKSNEYTYLIGLAFKSKNSTVREHTIYTFSKVVGLGVRKSEGISNFPKDFFSGTQGKIRAGICLQYLISRVASSKTIHDLYYMFSDTEGWELLDKYMLLRPCKDFFVTPVDYLHFALPDKNKDDLFHAYYRLCFLYYHTKKNGRRSNAKVNWRLKNK